MLSSGCLLSQFLPNIHLKDMKTVGVWAYSSISEINFILNWSIVLTVCSIHDTWKYGYVIMKYMINKCHNLIVYLLPTVVQSVLMCISILCRCLHFNLMVSYSDVYVIIHDNTSNIPIVYTHIYHTYIYITYAHSFSIVCKDVNICIS